MALSKCAAVCTLTNMHVSQGRVRPWEVKGMEGSMGQGLFPHANVRPVFPMQAITAPEGSTVLLFARGTSPEKWQSMSQIMPHHF